MGDKMLSWWYVLYQPSNASQFLSLILAKLSIYSYNTVKNYPIQHWFILLNQTCTTNHVEQFYVKLCWQPYDESRWIHFELKLVSQLICIQIKEEGDTNTKEGFVTKIIPLAIVIMTYSRIYISITYLDLSWLLCLFAHLQMPRLNYLWYLPTTTLSYMHIRKNIRQI